MRCGKQKRQASDDLLGSTGLSSDVVAGCCIRTTTLSGPCAAQRHMSGFSLRKPGAFAAAANQSRLRSKPPPPASQRMQKAAAMGRCGLYAIPDKSGPGSREHDSTELNHAPALSCCLSMIAGQTLRVCPEGKPVSAFPDHALIVVLTRGRRGRRTHAARMSP